MDFAVQSVIATGYEGTIVDIECHLSNNLPNIVIVGFANRAVDESRERIRGAFSTSRIMLPRKRITVNLAPADIPKADSGFDLAIAVAILRADGQLRNMPDGRQAFIGELGLDGTTRAVRGIIGKVLAGRARGITTFYIPAANLRQAQLVPEVTLIPIGSLSELYGHLAKTATLQPIVTGLGAYRADPPARQIYARRLDEVMGQAQAKRALEIAAAGGHNILFYGPPGTGKSMLAKALPGLLPPLSREEALEVTHLHSLAGHDYEQIITRRPFRAPHHSISYVALTGGGAQIRPGEISLAHRGVLFLDELPEFNRMALEALRQPLEDQVISVARSRAATEFPANFTLIATANFCPCGYYGSDNQCECTAAQLTRYRHKLSGPILDRIDLCSNVHKVRHDKLLAQPAKRTSQDIVRRIQKVRDRQAERFNSAHKLNADMTNDDIKRHGWLEDEAATLLNNAARNVMLSARGYMRTLKVARTIADLEDSKSIASSHVSEALTYRVQVTQDSKYR